MGQEPALSDFLSLSSKTSTFTSIDVVGSTALKIGASEQDIIYTFMAYHKLVSDQTYACHGDVISISGDGLMCRFQRAGDAATLAETILGQLPTFNKRHNRLARPLSLRLGIHTGPFHENQGSHAGRWISQTIDMAAKLQQSAEPDTLRISEATFNELKNHTSYRRAGWDARLGITIYEYKIHKTGASAKRGIPTTVHVLLVEHELTEISLLKKVFFARHYDSLTVYDPHQMSLCLSSYTPHLLLLSMDLPWNAGWSLLTEIRSNTKLSELPVIAMSNEATGHMIQQSFQKGANGLLQKPLEEQQIVKRVDMVLKEFYL